MSDDERRVSEEEIEQRKQARSGGRRVEQARNQPVPDKPAPAQEDAKEKS